MLIWTLNILGGCNSWETERGRSGLDVSQLRWFSHCIHNWSLDTPKDDPMNLIMNWNKTNQSPRDLGAKGKNANTSFSDRPFVRFYLASSSVNFNLYHPKREDHHHDHHHRHRHHHHDHHRWCITSPPCLNSTPTALPPSMRMRVTKTFKCHHQRSLIVFND